jgi:hypothetical protein
LIVGSAMPPAAPVMMMCFSFNMSFSSPFTTIASAPLADSVQIKRDEEAYSETLQSVARHRCSAITSQ